MNVRTSESHQLPDRWVGEWISPVEAHPLGADRPAYELQKSFELRSEAAQARVYATALGVYELFLNGERVGDEELAPGTTSYDSTVYAQSYDVSSMLKPGTNTLSVLLSDGWYRGRNGSTQDQDCWGSITAALVQLELMTPGGLDVVATDASWTSRRSQVTRADLMTGQTTDFTKPEAPASPVRVGITTGPVPSLSPAPPVRRIETLRPVSIRSLSEDASIVDFGQNIAGWARLDDIGPKGAVTTVTFGEHVGPDGDLSTEHLDTNTPAGEHIPFSQVDEVVSDGSGRSFEPRHTVHGFRYARVVHAGRALDAASITAVVVHTDLERTGWFQSDDERLNRLHEAGVWTFRGNAVDVPTDCPTRERSAWTGDYQSFITVATHLFDVTGFSAKWLQSVRDDQYDNGSLAMYSPDPLRTRINPHPGAMGGGSAGWGDAAVAVPWELYRHYGDTGVLAVSWESARAWVDFALRCAREIRHPSRLNRSAEPAPHEQFIWDGPFHFGEWLEPKPVDAPPSDPGTAFAALLSADQGEVATAYLFRSCSQLAAIARLLGKLDEAESLTATAEHVREAWRLEFLRDPGRTVLDTQSAYVRALAFGLIPNDQRDAAAGRLVELIAENDWRLGTGFLSTGMLLPVLADAGYVDVAFRLLTRTGVPSWLEMLERGGTTFWENWDNVREDGVAVPGSLNHYSKGAVIGFFYSHVAGLRQIPGGAGWREFIVAPEVGHLSRASATLDTPAGRISVEWRRDVDELELELDVPPGAVAHICLPGASEAVVRGGRYALRAHVPAERG